MQKDKPLNKGVFIQLLASGTIRSVFKNGLKLIPGQFSYYQNQV